MIRWLTLFLLTAFGAYAQPFGLQDPQFVGQAFSNACVGASISAQPTNWVGATNTTATFAVTATGTAPLAYQWHLGQSATNLVAGATTSSYTTNSSSAETNYYCCTVSNNCGSVTSSVVSAIWTNVASGCPSTPTVTNFVTISSQIAAGRTTSFYAGEIWPNDQPSHDLCRVDFKMVVGAGDPSTKHYRVGVWTVDGSWNLVSEIGNSSTVTGVNYGDWTAVEFDFSTPVTLAANTYYAIVCYVTESPDDTNSSNIGLGGDTLSGTNEWAAQWASDKSLTTPLTGNDAILNYYWP